MSTRQQEIVASIITLLIALIIVLLFRDSQAINMESVVALAVVLTALTLCATMGIMCFRLMATHTTKPITTSTVEGQFALLAGSIALFGVLITGVFVITSFRIQDTARAVATDIATTRAAQARTSQEEALRSFRQAHDQQMEGFRLTHEDELRSMRDMYENEARELASLNQQRLDAAVQQLTRRMEFLTGRDDPILRVGAQPILVGNEQTVVVAEEQLLTLMFSVPAAGRYRIDARAIDIGFDPYLYLYNEDGVLWAEDDDSGEGLNAQIEENLQAGTYYIGLEELGGRRGECMVLVTPQE